MPPCCCIVPGLIARVSPAIFSLDLENTSLAYLRVETEGMVHISDVRPVLDVISINRFDAPSMRQHHHRNLVDRLHNGISRNRCHSDRPN